jgi:hypothetical protein
MHGAKAPQAIAAARQRLAVLVEPAVATLASVLEAGKPAAVAVKAALGVLDRTGYSPRDHAVRLELPRVSSASDVVAALCSLVEQVAGGELAPATAGDVAALLREQRDALTLTMIDTRLRALEDR